MADDRTYIKLHDGMLDHPKIDPLSDAAFRLLIGGWCWCSRHLTDGVMPAATWTKRGSARARTELLQAGLVIDRGMTVEFHDYLQHQRSAEQVAAMKEQRRNAGRAGGLAKGKRPAKRAASEPSSKTEAETEGSSYEEPQTETDSPSRGRDGEPEGFAAFWMAYPRKIAKGAAIRAYSKALRLTTPVELLAAATRYATERQGQDEKFTAHPASWLNAQRWEDEAPAPTTDPVKAWLAAHPHVDPADEYLIPERLFR